jgi:hypothetical protein
MIEITRYEPKYENALRDLMGDEGLRFESIALCLDTSYVVVERNQVLGFGYYNSYHGEIYIDHLFIKPSERFNALGDSLFRALLNALMLQGVKEVYMRTDGPYHAFLEKEEIECVNGRYEIHLEEFFSRKCKGEKSKSGLIH